MTFHSQDSDAFRFGTLVRTSHKLAANIGEKDQGNSLPVCETSGQ